MNYCYVTLLTSDSYLQGVILLKESLRRVKTKYKLVCMINDKLSPTTLDALRKAGIEARKVDNITAPDNIYQHNKGISEIRANTWRDTFTKFRIWQMTEYDKVIFLDADLLILKNLDHCFDIELEPNQIIAAYDGEYFNIWPKDLHFNSGFFVFRPNEDTFNSLNKFIQELDPKALRDYAGQPMIVADQDVLNMYFSNWKTDKKLHLNKYYNVFAPYFWKENERDLMANAYFIHFVGIKPWEFVNNTPKTVLTDIPDKKSFWPFEFAFTIISMSYKNGFADLDWSNEDVLNRNMAAISAQIFKDNDMAAEYARRLPEGDAVRKEVLDAIYKKEMRDAVTGMLSVIYKQSTACPAYLYEIISAIYQDDRALYFWWNKLSKPVFDEFKGR